MDLSEPVAAVPFAKRRAGLRSLVRYRGALLLLGIAYGAYAALGWYTTIHLHVVLGDAASRLTHAYDVFWNQPPKLSALGFVWPPLMSAVFLPFALVKPLATGLWALPLMSASCGAALLLTLERALRRSGMRRPVRLLVVLLFGANPMIAAYAANGMSEILAQLLLTAAAAALVRWYSDREPRQLILVGIFMTLGVLVRYELALWLLVIVPAIGVMVAERRGRRLEFEASAVAVLAPVLYALGIWTALNWAILGRPFSWLHEETTQTFVDTRIAHPESFAPLHVLRIVLVENALLFPPLFIVAALLIAVGARKRDPMAICLSLLLLLNIGTTVALALYSQSPHLYELRFNIRTMPLVVVGIGWLYAQSESRPARVGVAAVAVLSLALSVPVTWHTMKTYRYRSDERQFVAALETGRDQSHALSGLDPSADSAMARYIVEHVPRPNSVLTDDAQTFGVILRSGRPELFVDRIDHGDGAWQQIAVRPYRKVQYLLISDIDIDILNRMYPSASPGLRLVDRTRTSRLYRVTGPVR